MIAVLLVFVLPILGALLLAWSDKGPTRCHAIAQHLGAELVRAERSGASPDRVRLLRELHLHYTDRAMRGE